MKSVNGFTYLTWKEALHPTVVANYPWYIRLLAKLAPLQHWWCVTFAGHIEADPFSNDFKFAKTIPGTGVPKFDPAEPYGEDRMPGAWERALKRKKHAN